MNFLGTFPTGVSPHSTLQNWFSVAFYSLTHNTHLIIQSDHLVAMSP